MHEFILPKEILQRMRDFRRSRQARDIPDYSLSEYWQYETDNMSIDILPDRVITSGSLGYYVPPGKWDLFVKIRKLLKNPKWYLPIAQKKLFQKFAQLMGAEEFMATMSTSAAYDAVMNHCDVSDPDLSPFRINFLDLKKNLGVASNVRELAEQYTQKTGLNLSDHLIVTYYQFNIISGLIDWNEIKTVLEIGPGNGNLASIIYSNHQKNFIVVDLPNTLCLSMAFLSNLFPDVKITMPHEAKTPLSENKGFTFLTPDQIHLIPDDFIDLSINTSSFQEMKKEQIEEYFELIERTSRNGGYFYTRNRAEKIPGGPEISSEISNEPVIRFSEFPWDPKNRVLAYEICRLGRLVQRDNMFIKMEQIIK